MTGLIAAHLRCLVAQLREKNDLERLLDLLQGNIFTDAPECANTVNEVNALVEKLSGQRTNPSNWKG